MNVLLTKHQKIEVADVIAECNSGVDVTIPGKVHPVQLGLNHVAYGYKGNAYNVVETGDEFPDGVLIYIPGIDVNDLMEDIDS